MESRVQCYRCKRYIRATDSHINLICKACQVDKKKMISKFLDFLKEFNDGPNYYEIEKEIEKWEGYLSDGGEKREN